MQNEIPVLEEEQSENGIVDLRLDELVQGRVTPLLPFKPLRLGKSAYTIPTRSLHHFARNDDARIADTLNTRVNQALVDLIGVQRASQGGRGGVDHVVGDAARLGEDGAETDTREDVDVVALVGVVGDDMVAVLDGVVGEGRTRREEDSPVCPVHGLFKGAFRLAEGVAEREENRSTAESASIHRRLEGTNDRLGEDTECSGQADEGAGLDILDNLLKGTELVAVIVGASEILLVLGELVTAVLRYQALGVNQPELVPGSLL